MEQLGSISLNNNLFTINEYNPYTLLELLEEYKKSINECINSTNECINFISWLKENGVKDEIIQTLELWRNNGVLENIINNNIFNSLSSEITQVTKSIDKYNDVKLIGHRGFSYLYPENCIETLQELKKYKNVGIEVDLRVTKDNQIILMHDSTVDRTTNGAGAVSSLNLTEIKALECGNYFNEFYQGIKVPTLEEFLSSACWCNFIVLQLNDFPLNKVDEVVALIEKYNMTSQCYVYTVGEYGQQQHFNRLYELNNNIKRIYRPNMNNQNDVTNFKNAKGTKYYIDYPSNILNNPSIVKEFGDLGIEVMASTTSTKEEYDKLVKIGVNKCLAETIWEV